MTDNNSKKNIKDIKLPLINNKSNQKEHNNKIN